MKPAEFLNVITGSRKGMIDRYISTSEPGALNKQLMHTAVTYIISEMDCETKKGVEYPIDDKQVLGRLMAKSVGDIRRNEIIDNKVIHRLKKSNEVDSIIARSPITCESRKGICQYCYGLNEKGQLYPIGTNIGAISGQSITEPATQLTMKTFHTGGTISSESVLANAFSSLKNMLEIPKEFPNKAIMAREDGIVESINENPLGGYDISISARGKSLNHYVPPGRKIIKEKGQDIARGDKLTDGVTNPREAVELLGIEPAREELSSNMHSLYSASGSQINKRHFETISRAILNNAQVLHSSDDSNFIRGDVIPYSEAFNENMKNEKRVRVSEKVIGTFLTRDAGPIARGKILTETDVAKLRDAKVSYIHINPEPAIIFTPIVKGIKMLPLQRRDFLGQLAYSHLKDAIKKGVPAGWETELSEHNPIPSVVYGADL
jgi:DNA-directed RNA polymerase subunit beta'